MEVGLMIATFVMSALSALCSVAALTILLVTTPMEERVTESPLPPDGDIPPLGKGGTLSATAKEKPPDVLEDVEKRRREAVNARQHSNFMNYDGTEQAPIDPNTILADGG